MTRLTTQPLHPKFGVEILGLDLAQAVSDDDFAFVRRAFAEAGVALIRGQDHISPDDHIAFSRRFGPLEEHVLTQFLLPGHPEIFVVSNIIENGRHIGAHGGATQYHSDLAYLAKPSLGSIFRCIECPDDGGETAFVSMAAAFDALPDALRRRLLGLDAVYDYAWSYDRRMAKIRGPLTAEQKAKTPVIMHPAVRAHPETGRAALFLSDVWVRCFEGMDEAESQALLAEVMAIAKAPEAEYRHRWRPGDIVLWDNRSTMHRVCPYDAENTRRLMHRTTITGERPVRAML
jgi:taurine dioxygenase